MCVRSKRARSSRAGKHSNSFSALTTGTRFLYISEISDVTGTIDALFGRPFLEALQEAAARLLFQSRKQGVDSSSVIGSSILKLNVLQESGDFVHQTYAEYLAALYLVRTLTTRVEDGRRLVRQHRFHSSLVLVFEFAAAILSAPEGNFLVPSQPEHRKLAFAAFWQELLHELRWSAGISHDSILWRCVSHTDSSQDFMFEDGGEFAAIREKLNAQRPTGPTMEGDDVVMADDAPAAGPAVSYSASQKPFVAPRLPWKYSERRSAIASIDVRQLSAAGKIDAMTWLVGKVRDHQGCFLVAQAAAEKLGELGKPTSDVVDALVFVAAKQAYGYKEAFASLVGMNALFDTMAERARVQDVVWGTYQMEWALSRLVEEKWPLFMLDWFSKQPACMARVGCLLKKLFDPDVIMRDPDLVLRTLNDGISDSLDQEVLALAELSTTRRSSAIFLYVHLGCRARDAQQRIEADARVLELLHTPVLQELLARFDDGHHYANDGLRTLFAQIVSILSRTAGAADTHSAWRDALIAETTNAINSINRRSKKHTIPVLMETIFQLRPPPIDVRSLMAALFSQASDQTGGYWDCDAVIPSFASAYPYWSEILAAYMVYKITADFFPTVLALGPSFAVAAEAFTEEQQRWAVWACAHVIEHLLVEQQDRVDGVLGAFSLTRFAAGTVCAQLLSDRHRTSFSPRIGGTRLPSTLGAIKQRHRLRLVRRCSNCTCRRRPAFSPFAQQQRDCHLASGYS